MLILVLNSGSSSIKYQIFDITEDRSTLAGNGVVDRIGSEDASITHVAMGKDHVHVQGKVSHHQEGISRVLSLIVGAPHGCIGDISEIKAIGHRVVHGGELFKKPVLVDHQVKAAIKEFAKYAPLHNPANLDGIWACERCLPNVPQVAVFDTAFHSDMPPHTYLYGIPLEYYEEEGIRKYGFHGSSHQYVSQEAARILQEMGRTTDTVRIVTCHLGNGSSVAAVKGERSIDTSMGYTPLDGLIMGTRCGSIDPAIVLQMAQYWGLPQVDTILNRESGFKGLTGFSDVRDLLAIYARQWKKVSQDRVREMGKNERAKLRETVETALKMFATQIKKYIGAYAAILGGIDAVVFTAGIGENSAQIREWILEEMDWMGIVLDRPANRENRTVISREDGKALALVIPTNEELIIARETYKVVSKGSKE